MYKLSLMKRGKLQIPYWVLHNVEIVSTKSVYPMGTPSEENVQAMYKQLKTMESDLWFPALHYSHHSAIDPYTENLVAGFHDNVKMTESEKYGLCLSADFWFFSFPSELVQGRVKGRSMEGIMLSSKKEKDATTWLYKSLALLSSKAPNCVFPGFGPDTITLSKEAETYWNKYHKEDIEQDLANNEPYDKNNLALSIQNPKQVPIFLSLQEGAGMDDITIKKINLSEDEENKDEKEKDEKSGKKIDDETAALAQEVEALQEKLDQRTNQSKTKETLMKLKEKLQQKLAETEGEDEDEEGKEKENGEKEKENENKDKKKDDKMKKDDDNKNDQGKALQLALSVAEIKKQLGESSAATEQFLLELLEKGFTAKEIIKNIKSEINWESTGKEIGDTKTIDSESELGPKWEDIKKNLHPDMLKVMDMDEKARLVEYVTKQEKFYNENPELLQDVRR